MPQISDSPDAGPVGIVLAGYYTVFREAVERWIGDAPNLALRASADSGFTALEAIRTHHPSVAILDLSFDDLNGEAILNAIDRERLDTQCVFVAEDADAPMAAATIAAGAAGWLEFYTTEQELFDAIEIAAARSVRVAGRAHRTLVEEVVRHKDTTAEPEPIDYRAREVLQLCADGMSLTQIGRELNIATATVRGRLHKVYPRLGVSDKTAAVAEALRRGLIS